MRASIAKNIADYISEFDPESQHLLIQMWETIAQAAPEAGEDIKYAMPTFILKGNLVHFASFKNHIGFYPGPKAIQFFSEELANFKTSKGAIQFPKNQPLPLSLVTKIVQFRVNEQLTKKG
ncbi:MAG: DUF1801 domain-containing protein [Bacteroidetes bacterium]|nr:DUF1801 domain-containing protein [Bacteroidota bacterium]